MTGDGSATSIPSDIPVVIVGMGPTGLMLAGELRLYGVDCLVLGIAGAPSDESRALGFTSSTLELFAHRGMLDEFGPLETNDAVHFAGLAISAALLSSPYQPVARFPQHRTEAVLRKRAERLGATIRTGVTVTAVDEHDGVVETTGVSPDGVPVRVRSRYVVGCDGAHSAVRRLAGLEYPLTAPNFQMLLADLQHAGLPNNPFGRKTPGGMVMSGPIDAHTDRLIVRDRHAPPLERGAPVTEEQLTLAYRNVTGQELPSGRIAWASSFSDASGLASSFRRGPVFLAGDAAHTNFPAGGQGMNVSVQDAANLGWKLAAAVLGWGDEELLDSYDTERRQVAQELLGNTRAQGHLFLGGPEVDPVRELLTRVMSVPAAATLMADEVSGLGTRYGDGSAPEPVGRLVPTKHLSRPGEEGPPQGLLRDGRGALLRADDTLDADTARQWKSRVDTRVVQWLDGDGTAVPGQDLLVRPDGYVAWSSNAGEPLADALSRWFGRV